MKHICLKQFYHLWMKAEGREKVEGKGRKVDFDVLNSPDTHRQAIFFCCTYTFLQNTNLRQSYFESMISKAKRDYFISLPNTKKKRPQYNP